MKESMMPANNVVVESEVANSDPRGGSQENDVPTSKSNPTEEFLPPHPMDKNLKSEILCNDEPEQTFRVISLKDHSQDGSYIISWNDDSLYETYKQSDANQILSVDRGLHLRIDPNQTYPLYGDVDPKNGRHATFEEFRDSFIAFMEGEYNERITKDDFLPPTVNVAKEGSFHWHMKTQSLKAKASKQKELMLHFRATGYLYGWSSEYDKEMIDLSIYDRHLFRLPNQTVGGKKPKTKHEVVGSELKNYVLIPSENARSIDDIKTKADKLAEWKPVIKKPTPIEDEDELGEDEKEPDLHPPDDADEVPDDDGYETHICDIEPPVEKQPDEEKKDDQIQPEPEEKQAIERDDKIIKAFKKFHPNAEFDKKTQYEHSVKFDFKFTTEDKCKIHKRAHKSNRNYAIFFPEQQKAFYKCYDDDCPTKILLINFNQNKVATNRNSFDKTDLFVFEDFVKKYAGTVFKNYDEMVNSFVEDFPRVIARISKTKEVYYRKLANDQFDFMKSFTENDKISVQYEKVIKKQTFIYSQDLQSLIISLKARLPLYRGVCCKIDTSLIERGQFNTWQGFVAKKVEINEEAIKKIQPMLDFIKVVIANNQEDRYQYLLKWWSYTVSTNQKPLGKAPVLFGEPGIGKTIYCEFFAYYVLGKNVCAFLDRIGCIAEKFNSRLDGKRFIYVKEIASAKEEFRAIFEQIKTWITDENQQIERKFIDAYDTDCVASWHFSTNHPDSIFIEDKDRIYFCLDVNPIHRNDEKYFQELKDLCFNQECGDIFYSYLLQINANRLDISEPPETDLHKRMIMLYQPSWISFIKLAIEELNEPIPDKPTELHGMMWSKEQLKSFQESSLEIKASELYAKYRMWCAENGEKPTNVKNSVV